MYITKGTKKLTAGLVERAVKERIVSFNKYNSRKKINTEFFGENYSAVVNEIINLNNALLEQEKKGGNRVFAICVKAPKGNLDTGKHYFEIFYIKDGSLTKFWVYDFMRALGAEEKSMESGLSKWVWGSGAIGMSRLLSATDSIFSFLRDIGGCYCQIDCI